MIADYMDIILIVKQTFIVFFAEGLELGSIVWCQWYAEVAS